MQRRILFLILPALLAAGTARAEDPTVARIMRELRSLGYAQVSVERTLLGRSRILANGPEASREIIVNPATGEILRDLWIPHGPGDGRSDALLERDDDHDDESDDDADDDGGRGRGRGRGGDD